MGIKIFNRPNIKDIDTSLDNINIEWDVFFNALVHPTLILDQSQIILAVNPMAQELINRPMGEICGVNCYKLVHDPQSDQPPANCPAQKLLNEGITETVEMEMEVFDKYGLVSCTPILDEKNALKYIIHLVTDTTDRKITEQQLETSLNEKKILLKEIHHRVKNNMQIISSLLDLQSEYIQDQDDMALFLDSKSQVRSMALIHEKLYLSGDLGSINLKDYIISLIDHLFSAFYVNPDNIKLDLKMDVDINLDINSAIPLGLLINELITNSIKYAFPVGEKGTIKIESSKEDHNFFLIIADDGVGMPDNVDLMTDKTLGLQLVTNLARQLGGEIHLKKDNGTRVELVLPENLII